MVDGVYQDIFEALKPGVRESDIVALAHARLFEMGSEFVEAINSIAGERCSPHPHVFSDRLIRPGDQAYFDIIHVYNGYRTCYYRTFVVGRATQAQRDAFTRSREWMDAAIDLVKPGVATDQIAAVWPKAEEFGFADEMDAFGLAVRPRRRREPARAADHQPAQLVRGSARAQGGHALRPRDLLPGRGRSLGGADRGGGHRHRRRLPRSSRCSRATSSWSRTSTEGGPSWRTRKRSTRTDVSEVADLETRLSIYRMMQEGRLFETRAQDLFLEGLVKGTSHLGIGQEAVAAGFAAALQPDDLVFCTYRGHVHTLLRGAPMAALMAELLGRATGICGGKGGSMHLTDVSHGAMGSYAIVGAHMPIAAGAAWAAQARGTGQVAVCFFGDGTTNIGTFHEALNLAAVWKLPVVFVCENNLYMEYTPIGDVTAVEHPAADRASAYGLDSILVDGNDADEVHATAVRAVARARVRRRPVAHRGDDLPARRSLARRPGEVPTGGGGRGMDGSRPDPLLPRAAARRRRRRGDAGRDRGRRAGRGRSGHGGRAQRAVPRSATRSRPSSGPTEAPRGGTDLPRGRRARDRAGDGARSRPSTSSARTSQPPAASSRRPRDCSNGSGAKRVRDTPISEQAIIGAAMGAAMNGLRPIAELMFSDFFAVCWDIVANQIAKARYMTNGQIALPIVIRTANGGGVRFGAQHSQSVETWMMAIPGLKVVVPSTPLDMIGLFAAAVRDPDPVVVVEPKVLYASKGEVPDGEIVDRLGEARTVRDGGRRHDLRARRDGPQGARGGRTPGRGRRRRPT